jgi:hypothetical protein
MSSSQVNFTDVSEGPTYLLSVSRGMVIHSHHSESLKSHVLYNTKHYRCDGFYSEYI